MADLEKDLSLKIEGNANEAAIAIDGLINRLRTLNQSLDLGNLNNFSRQLSQIASAANKIDGSTIKGFASSISALNKAQGSLKSSENLKAVADQAENVKAKIHEMAAELALDTKNSTKVTSELEQKLASIYELTSSRTRGGQKISALDMKMIDDTIDSMTRLISENQKFTKSNADVYDSYSRVRDYINKSGKIHVPTEELDGYEHFARDMSVIGRKNLSTKGGQEFDSFIQELVGEFKELRGSIDDTASAGDQFKQLADWLRKAKEESESLSVNLSTWERAEILKHIPEEASEAALKMMDLGKATTNFEKSFDSDPYKGISDALASLQGVSLPDFSPLDGLASSLERLSKINASAIQKVAKAVNSFNGGANVTPVQAATSAFQQMASVVGGDVNSALSKARAEVDYIVDEAGNAMPRLKGYQSLFDQMGTSLAVIQNGTGLRDTIDRAGTSVGRLASEFENAAQKAELVVRSAGEIRESTVDYGDDPIGEFVDVDGYRELASLREYDLEEEKKAIAARKGEKSANIDLLASLVALGHELERVASTFDRWGDAGISLLKKVFLPLNVAFKGFREKVVGMATAMKNLRDNMQKHLDKMSAFWKRTMKTFTFMLVRKAITAILNETKNAVDSLARWSNQFGTAFNTSMSEITADASYLARNLVAMFEPVINAIVPILNTLVEALARAARAVAEFFAAFTGQSYFMVAKKKVGNYAAELDKANKKQKQLTMGIDELNILNEGDSGSGSDNGAGFGDEWDTAPVSDKMKNLADEIKKILEKLFEPLKKAWDIAGDYVLGGFKYMKEEIGKLLASIGKDFLEVWNQPETVKMLTNLLYILGDIEYTIGNLAKGFREAWEEGDKGKKIFEAIRDILAILIQHVRNVTLYMREWSQNINFNPLLEKALELLQKMSTVAEFFGGVFEDIMKNVVLEYIEFLIEEGIPHLLDTIGQIIDSFDFEKLRSQLVPLEQAFEGMLENIDTGITNAIGNVGKAVGEFTQTEDFQKFLDNVQWFMDQITAERVEKLFTALGLAITNMAEALVKFVGSDQFKDFMQKLLDWFDSKSPEEIADGIDKIALAIAGFKFTGFVGKGLSGFTSFLSVLASAKSAIGILTGIGSAGTAAGAGTAAAGAGGTAAAGGFGAMAASIAPVAGIIAGVVAAVYSFTESFGGVEGALTRLKTLFDDVGKVISHVAEEFKISEHIEHLKETIGRLLGSLGNMKDFWEVILNVLKYVADAVAVVLVPAFDILVKTIDLVISIIGRIIDNLGALGTIIMGVFEGNFSKILEGVERFVNNFLGFFKDLKYWLIGDPIVYDIVDGVVGAFKEMVTNAVNAVKNFVTKTVNFFKDLWSKVVDRATKIKDDVVARWNALQEGVKAIVSILVTWVIGKWNELKQNVEEKVRLLKESIIQKWQEIKSNVEEKIRLLKDYIVQKWQEIRDKAEELWNKIKENIITPIQEAWNKLFGTDGLIASIVTKAKAAWEQIKEDVEKILVKVKDAIIAPFKDAWDALFGDNGWITGLVKKIKSAFNDISGDEITKMLKGVGDAIVAPFKSAYEAAMGENGWVSQLLKGINSFFDSIKTAIENSPLGKFFENIAEKIKGLKEKLDGLKSDAKEAESSTRTSSTQGYFNGGIVQYATGGYPSRGTLFWAGEYGLPEMIGTVGGRTAVASSAEITGIRESVMESSIAEQNMMGQMINLLQAIAAKDLSVNMDSRELVSSLNDRARRNGYNFQMA